MSFLSQKIVFCLILLKNFKKIKKKLKNFLKNKLLVKNIYIRKNFLMCNFFIKIFNYL